MLEEQFRRAHVHQLGSSNPVPLPHWLREELKELTEMERQEPALLMAPSEHPKGQPHACSPQQQGHFKVGLGKRKNSTPFSPRISFRAPAVPKNGPGSPDCERQSCGFATEGVSAALC